MPRPDDRIRILATGLAGAALVAASLASAPTARAQVSPIGAHNATLGPGTGVNGPVSPTGGVAASVPLSLPAARGGVPVPLSIVYSGSARVGAAGVGWTLPLSYVRLNDSTVRRKPALVGDDAGDHTAPLRVTVSLGGGPQLMVPASNGLVWIPAIGDAYQELSPSGDGWELRTTGGLVYTFRPVAALAGSGIDPSNLRNVWLLASVTDAAGHDRVDVSYTIGQYGNINISGLSYGVAANGEPLYKVSLSYRGWDTPNGYGLGWDAAALAAGLDVDREGIIDDISVVAADNLSTDVSSSAPRRRIRAWHFTYDADADTGMPRLAKVEVRGEDSGGTDTSLPVASYTYGAVTRLDGGIAYEGTKTIDRSYGSSADKYANGIAETDVSHVTTQDGDVLDFIETRHVIRDFTGDGVPDLVYRDDAETWHLVPGHVSDAGVDLSGADYTWNDFPEIFEQITHHPPDWDHVNPVTTMTRVEFLDWNGDGRMDVVDSVSSPSKDIWRIWINQGLSDHHVAWRHIDVSVGDFEQLAADHGLQAQDQMFGAQFLGLLDRFPIERTRSWPRYHRVECHLRPDLTEDCPGNPSYEVSVPIDTIAEWTLRDVNGDGFPDFDLLASPVVRCTHHVPESCNDYACSSEDEDKLQLDGCPDATSTPPGPPASQTPSVEVLLNATGALDPVAGGSAFVPAPAGTRFKYWPGWWMGGALIAGSWPDLDVSGGGATPPAGDATPAYEREGAMDVDGVGLLNGVGATFDSMGAPVWPATFSSNRSEQCYTSAPDWVPYTTRQVTGYADLNGDGIPDRVWQDWESRYEDGEWVGGYTGAWHVRFGEGNGSEGSEARTIYGHFELSSTEGTCGGKTTTKEGLLDVDGDGRPEVVRIENGALIATPIRLSDGGPTAITAGRLDSITNGDGATTYIDYANNKANGLDIGSDELPFPEVVVAGLHTVLPSGKGDPVAPVRFAYGNARLAYDPYFARWSFTGYDRTVTLSGTGTSRVNGTAVIADRMPVPASPQTWAQVAFAGRPHVVSTLEGTFPADPRIKLGLAVAGDSQLRSQATFEYGTRPLPTSDTVEDHDECFGSAAETGSWPNGDAALCHRAGIVYAASVIRWGGSHAPPADRQRCDRDIRDQGRRHRPAGTEIMDMGDTRSNDDDVCREIDWAAAPSDDRGDQRGSRRPRHRLRLGRPAARSGEPRAGTSPGRSPASGSRTTTSPRARSPEGG